MTLWTTREIERDRFRSADGRVDRSVPIVAGNPRRTVALTDSLDASPHSEPTSGSGATHHASKPCGDALRYCRNRAPCRSRNPETGEPVPIAASRVPAFKAAKTLGTRSTGSMASAAVRTTVPNPETPPGRPMTYVWGRDDHRRLEPVGMYAVRLLVRITRPLRKGVASGFSDLTRPLRVSPPPATLVRYHNRTLGAGTSPWCASGGEIGTTQGSSAPTR